MDQAIIVIIGVLVVSVLMWVLMPTFTGFITSANLNSINITGAINSSHGSSNTLNYGWSGQLFVIIYVLAAALLPLGLLGYVVYKYAKK